MLQTSRWHVSSGSFSGSPFSAQSTASHVPVFRRSVADMKEEDEVGLSWSGAHKWTAEHATSLLLDLNHFCLFSFKFSNSQCQTASYLPCVIFHAFPWPCVLCRKENLHGGQRGRGQRQREPYTEYCDCERQIRANGCFWPGKTAKHIKLLRPAVENCPETAFVNTFRNLRPQKYFIMNKIPFF